MKIENVKACVFDAYGTLFDVNSAAAKCKEKLGGKWEGFANCLLYTSDAADDSFV